LQALELQDAMKYQYAVPFLDPDLLREIKDLTKNLLQSDKYEVLKARIVSEFQVSEERRLKELLNQAEFRDHHPSPFFRRMRDFAESRMSDLFKALWMQRLPTTMQAILATRRDDQALDDLAVLADRIHEITMPSVGYIRNRTTAIFGKPSF